MMWKYSSSLFSWNLIEVTVLHCKHITQPKFNIKQDKTKPRQLRGISNFSSISGSFSMDDLDSQIAVLSSKLSPTD